MTFLKIRLSSGMKVHQSKNKKIPGRHQITHVRILKIMKDGSIILNRVAAKSAPGKLHNKSCRIMDAYAYQI